MKFGVFDHMDDCCIPLIYEFEALLDLA